MQIIKIYNPRILLRKGSLEFMSDAADGHIVLLRLGDVTGDNPTIAPTRNITSRPEWQKLRNRVFRLVEVSAEDIATLQKLVEDF